MLSDPVTKLAWSKEGGLMFGLDYHVDVCGECGTQAVPQDGEADAQMQCPNCLGHSPIVRFPVMILAGEGDPYATETEDGE
jgi:hypothetical protein